MVATVNSAAATKGMAPVSLGAEQPSPEDWKQLDESLYLKLPNRLNVFSNKFKNTAFCTRLSDFVTWPWWKRIGSDQRIKCDHSFEIGRGLT